MIKEPKRMSEEPSALGASVAAVRERLPSEARLAGLAARLDAAGASLDFGATPPTSKRTELGTAQPPVAKSDFARKMLVLSLFALGGAGVVGWVIADHVHAARQMKEPSRVVHVSDAEPVSSVAQRVAPAPAVVGVAPARADVPRTPAEPARAAGSVEAAPLGSVADSDSHPERASAAASTSEAHEERVEPSPPTKTSQPADARGPAHSPSGRSNGAAPEPSPGAPLAKDNVVTSELELLKQARSALPADPAQAFALTERCRAQYPNGDLAQERDYIAISALVRLGRSSEAISRATLFRMHYPASAYLPRLARLLGDQ